MGVAAKRGRVRKVVDWDILAEKHLKLRYFMGGDGLASQRNEGPFFSIE